MDSENGTKEATIGDTLVIFIAIKMLHARLKSLISLCRLRLFQLARAQREKREEREKEIDDRSS